MMPASELQAMPRGAQKSNLKTGLLLAALALVFFLTVVLKYVFIR